MIQASRVELHELHVGNGGARAVCHRHAVAGGDVRIGRVEVNLPAAAGGQHDDRRGKRFDLARFLVEDIGPHTMVDVLGALGPPGGFRNRRRPTAFGEKLGMDEIETVERMAFVLDAAVHMRAASLAGVTLDRRRGVDDLELVAVFEHGDVVAGDHGDDRKGGALGLPAFGAAAGVVVGDIALDADLDRPVLAFADQRAAGKAAGAFFDAAINRWVDMNSHGLSSLGLTFLI